MEMVSAFFSPVCFSPVEQHARLSGETKGPPLSSTASTYPPQRLCDAARAGTSAAASFFTLHKLPIKIPTGFSINYDIIKHTGGPHSAGAPRRAVAALWGWRAGRAAAPRAAAGQSANAGAFRRPGPWREGKPARFWLSHEARRCLLPASSTLSPSLFPLPLNPGATRNDTLFWVEDLKTVAHSLP